MKIISKEFGGSDDMEFLKIAWKMSIKDLEELLKNTLSDLTYIKNTMPRGGVTSLNAKRDLSILKSRIKFTKQIISYKKKDPSYIPDFIKK